MATLITAAEIAYKCHTGQVDKGGHPYIFHAWRVANRCQSITAQKVGLLHDTVEDSDLTLDDLRAAGFDEETVNGVDAVTKRPGENYPLRIIRVKRNAIGTEVKIADLSENLDASRLPIEITERHLYNIVKYRWSLAFLLNEISEVEYLELCAAKGIK